METHGVKEARSNGFSVIELIIVAAILSFIVFSVASLNIQLRQQQVQSTNLVSLDVFKRNLIAIVLDGPSWQKTIAAGAPAGANPLGNMGCLLSGTSCTVDGTPTGAPIENQSFALYDAAGKLILDATDPKNGITLNGTLCKSYSVTGVNNCSLRFDLKWSAICTGACISPMVKVNAALLYPAQAGQPQITINLSTYSVPDIMRTAQ